MVELDEMLAKDDREHLRIEPLLEKHREAIEKLKIKCADVLSEPPVPSSFYYDDIFLLRFILSKKKVETAEKCIRETIKYRNDNKAVFMRAAEGLPHPESANFLKYVKNGQYKTTKFNEPVFYVRAGKGDQKGLMKNLSTETILDYLNYQKLLAYDLCDTATRESGILTKSINIVDLDGMSLFGMNIGFAKCLGASSKFGEQNCPQLMGVAVMMNAPPIYEAMFKLVSQFASKAFIEKVKICTGKVGGNENSSIARCPHASKWFEEEAVPDFAGGSDVAHPFKIS